MKKKVLLRKIIKNFATSSELARFDELSNINVGSSCHFALRLIEDYFAKKRENKTDSSRTLRVNGYGKSWYQ